MGTNKIQKLKPADQLKAVTNLSGRLQVQLEGICIFINVNKPKIKSTDFIKDGKS